MDWAGNILKFKNKINTFNSFDKAEFYLQKQLGDNYDTDRQEYYIVKKKV